MRVNSNNPSHSPIRMVLSLVHFMFHPLLIENERVPLQFNAREGKPFCRPPLARIPLLEPICPCWQARSVPFFAPICVLSSRVDATKVGLDQVQGLDSEAKSPKTQVLEASHHDREGLPSGAS